MTTRELAEYDGRDGRAAYVAVSGVIYDVSASPLWKDGDHEGAHQAGHDLTEELKSAPHVRSVVERFPVVGRLSEEPPAQARPGGLPLLSILIIAFVFILLLVTFLI